MTFLNWDDGRSTRHDRTCLLCRDECVQNAESCRGLEGLAIYGTSGWFLGQDERFVVAGKAERRPPVEATYLDVHASSALKDGGVAVSVDIDDAHLSARAKYPDGFAESIGAFVSASDVVEGQAAEHHVERLGRKRKASGVGLYQLDTFAHTLDHRVMLGGGSAIACLVA